MEEYDRTGHELINNDCEIIMEHNGLLPSPNKVFYSQIDPSKHPMTARRLLDRGYQLYWYKWLYIPTMKKGVSPLWVPIKEWANALVEFWNYVGGDVWKYSNEHPN